MNTMTLIFVKGPGNVLAGLSRTAVAPESPPPTGLTNAQKRAIEIQLVGELIGNEMLVRSLMQKTGATSYVVSGVEFHIPLEQFGVYTGELDPNALRDPRSYYVDESGTKPTVKPLPGLTTTGSAPDSASFTGSDLTVVLPADVAIDTGVWALTQPSGGSGSIDQVIRYDVLKKDATVKDKMKLNGAKPLQPGPYSVLTLVTGYQPTVFPA